jgi:FkbH-like protein
MVGPGGASIGALTAEAMKETLASDRIRTDIALPPDVAAGFAETRAALKGRSLIVWGEHCSECAYPACYAHCAFYTPRTDLNCRRFERGIEPLAAAPDAFRIRFRKWGKLEGKGPAPLRPIAAAARLSRADSLVEAVLSAPLPYAAGRNLAWRWNRRKADPAAVRRPLAAEALVVETWAADGKAHTLTLTLLEQEVGGAMHQVRFEARPAYGRLVVPVSAFAGRVDLSRPFLIQIEPVGEAAGRDIVFGLVDFVAFTGARLESVSPKAGSSTGSKAAEAPAKVVVWDLDETLWTGTLAEDGAAGVRPRPEAVAAIEALDQRGVLQSIASKNDAAEALAALEGFGLAHYFLHPQVAWTPKSDSLARIAKALDLGLDSFVFIDDQPFERGEVAAAHPQVRALDEHAVAELVAHRWFDLPVTPESRRRREMYVAEAQRSAAFDDVGSDYLAFLKGCAIALDARPLAAPDMERVYELSQRTNQLNFNGAKFSRAEVEALAQPNPDRLALTLRCSDRFGDYGLIGFAVLDLKAGRLDNFFMSCRVQRKRVEHAAFALMAERLRARGFDTFRAAFRKTERNKASIDMLTDLGFTALGDVGQAAEWVRAAALPFADSDVVRLAPARQAA